MERKMLEFEFRKTDAGWWVSGKAKSCSSKKRMFNYIWNEFNKQLPGATGGKITIKEIN